MNFAIIPLLVAAAAATEPGTSKGGGLLNYSSAAHAPASASKEAAPRREGKKIELQLHVLESMERLPERNLKEAPSRRNSSRP